MLLAAPFITILLVATGIGLRAALAYGSVVTDLPFIGGETVSCDMPWHEDCLNEVPGYGIDFAMSCGETVYAAGRGQVYRAGDYGEGWGNEVVIRQADGSGGYYYHRYAHLTYYFPAVNSWVGNGSPIGYSGQTGHADGCHLHFEMYHNGLTSGYSLPFTPIYGLRNTDLQYQYEDVVYGAVLQHDRYNGPTKTIDDREPDPGFSTVSWWSTANYGFDRGGLYNAYTHWTYSNGDTVDSKAYWAPSLNRGVYYRVYVFIPNNYATTRKAHYQITNGVNTWNKYVDQYGYYNDWVYLGYYQATNGWLSVRVDDATGENSGTTLIAADAAMFAR